VIINLSNDELKRVSSVLREKKQRLEEQVKEKSKNEFLPDVYNCVLESIELDSKLIAYLESKIERDY
jgi:hypothetical protein